MTMASTFKARVRKGRLVLDEPTDLPEGAEIDLVPVLESADESPDVVDAAWRAEIGKRIAEIEAGDVELESWDDVRRQAAEVLRRE